MVSKAWIQRRSFDSEIERVTLVKRTVSFQTQGKKVDTNITLALTYHPALN